MIIAPMAETRKGWYTATNKVNFHGGYGLNMYEIGNSQDRLASATILESRDHTATSALYLNSNADLKRETQVG
ncbi:hypothetical protein B7463_g11989, partial [Scytalidium lignicola]